MIFLQNEQLRTNLSLGRKVEQWLGYKQEDSYIILRWISLEKEDNGEFSVAYIESFDEGNEDFIDVYEFSTLDPDEPLGIINTFSTLDEAIDFSLDEYGAEIDNFINAGMIQEEYRTYLNLKANR
ncbi:hypothetical protein SAMN05421820_1166 [Pedobacter steynii]|uniref:Uncharacterized protein n=1 Tax=Pedobacter steynii TaxID=430522 RepID=A0A1H0KBM8_9SPHI|nr:hypothetical protein [Pedobacter steynii]NQX43247.1 hypothetical protein [Pedobacter steynii]SDO53171.1 hypothetical protein SAMN05421820_1166 [Pedobacter steynii]